MEIDIGKEIQEFKEKLASLPAEERAFRVMKSFFDLLEFKFMNDDDIPEDLFVGFQDYLNDPRNGKAKEIALERISKESERELLNLGFILNKKGKHSAERAKGAELVKQFHKRMTGRTN